MAHNFKNATLSLTLPISCQICLGKVRQPVICANYHVFCSTCMEMWLKKASQCPTCRVPISAEEPCREIIGHTNETECNESQSMKKRLRKTRGELFLREYEDEIEGLLRENEELKTKNQTLESQLMTALDPCSINVVQREDSSIDPSVLEEWTNKLRAATDLYSKVKQDMERLKEANKTLRSQNIDLVQENMQLKAEVASRSPQKFGRYTVAALEAKIHQYERDVDHLRRALERSDQYIEELESRVSEGEKRPPDQREASNPYNRAPLESTASGDNEARTEAHMEHQKLHMMRRSLSDTERESICNPEVGCQTLPGNCSFLFTASVGLSGEFGKTLTGQRKDEDIDNPSSQLLPSTPSSAFRSLTLKSPGIRSEKKVAFKPLSYQRRLSFEDVAEPGNSGNADSTTETKFSSLSKFSKGWSPSMKEEPSKPVSWEDWQRTKSSDQPCPGPSKAQSPISATPKNLSDKESVSFHMFSEASMDAAYLDKISELDSMMLDGESSSSRGSHLSLASSPPPDFDVTLVPEPKTCPQILTDCGGEDDAVMGGNLSMSCDQQNRSPCDITDGTLNDSEPPAGSAEMGAPGPFSGREDDAHRLDCAGSGVPSQTDELSFDLLFDPLVENEADPSGSVSSADQSHDHHISPSSSNTGCHVESGNRARDRQTAIAISQPTKRKSHSPFNASSPTKLSKLM